MTMCVVVKKIKYVQKQSKYLLYRIEKPIYQLYLGFYVKRNIRLH